MPKHRDRRLLLLFTLLATIFFQSTVAKTRWSQHNADVRQYKRQTLPASSTTTVIRNSNRRVSHSGRLLGKPNPFKCVRRPRTVLDKASGHYYFFSDDTRYKGHEVSWLDARNLCREQCMDLVSIETVGENQMIKDLISQRGLHEVWTSGRLCNFHGCNKPHLQPRHINGWFWSGTGISIAATNSTPPGWGRQPWSRTGLIGQFLAHPVAQPDNAEYLINPSLVTVEACLAIHNNWYNDGISWHDVACYRKKPFICEDSEVLMRRAKAINPNLIF